MRESGILFPIFSLPSKFGIGSFSREAKEFIDFLEKSGQGFWQILPIGPTGYGDSPYQPYSAFAGNPYFVSPETLIEEGYLRWEDCNRMHFGIDEERVDYGALYEERYELLQIAYDRFLLKEQEQKEFEAYKKKESYWLKDYALYKTIKDEQGGASFMDWDKGFKKREPATMAQVEKALADRIDFYSWIQYEFEKQWMAIKKYANEKNIKIIGDLPFYVSLDSADVWAHPEVFQMDKNLTPKVVAGCPPDAFSSTGQLWGNPIYDWEYLKTTGYDWWVKRMKRNFRLFDVIRIDHFHGFSGYYAIPYKDDNALHGKLKKGPGMDLFDKLRAELGDLNIIAEDLGTKTPENEKLLQDSGFPGMKVLQFGFTSWDSDYVNHRHVRNSVVYTGTHDNTPTRAWVEEISDAERDFTRRYVNSINTDYGQLTWDIIREAFRSVSDLCIIPLQDYLCKGKESRINTPGVADGNWQWRLRPNFLSDELAMSIRGLTELYSRIPKAPEKDKKKKKI